MRVFDDSMTNVTVTGRHDLTTGQDDVTLLNNPSGILLFGKHFKRLLTFEGLLMEIILPPISEIVDTPLKG